MIRDPKEMTLNEIDAAIEALYVERAKVVRAGERLKTWHGEARLLALEQEAADRIPEWCTVERRNMVPPRATEMAGANGQIDHHPRAEGAT